MKNLIRMIALLMVLTVLMCGCEEPQKGNHTEPSNTETTPSTTGITIPTKPSTEPTDDGKVTYTVTVVDQNGDPVQNVIIQFCDDENCKLPAATDANGTVTASYEESEYHITLTELPAGYSSAETEFYFGDSTELTITITAD